MDGRYTIEVPDNSILVFSFLGYKSVESPVKNNSVINITMQEDSRSLEEVVVVGYGCICGRRRSIGRAFCFDYVSITARSSS
jgi:hypothetical protein